MESLVRSGKVMKACVCVCLTAELSIYFLFGGSYCFGTQTGNRNGWEAEAKRNHIFTCLTSVDVLFVNLQTHFMSVICSNAGRETYLLPGEDGCGHADRLTAQVNLRAAHVEHFTRWRDDERRCKHNGTGWDRSEILSLTANTQWPCRNFVWACSVCFYIEKGIQCLKMDECELGDHETTRLFLSAFQLSLAYKHWNTPTSLFTFSNFLRNSIKDEVRQTQESVFMNSSANVSKANC